MTMILVEHRLSGNGVCPLQQRGRRVGVGFQSIFNETVDARVGHCGSGFIENGLEADAPL